jgi:hypothetical protein
MCSVQTRFKVLDGLKLSILLPQTPECWSAVTTGMHHYACLFLNIFNLRLGESRLQNLCIWRTDYFIR